MYAASTLLCGQVSFSVAFVKVTRMTSVETPYRGPPALLSTRLVGAGAGSAGDDRRPLLRACEILQLSGYKTAGGDTAACEGRPFGARGRGKKQAALANIFRPFYRVADARDRQSGGIGVGLSISQRAVEIHRGIVTASNAPLGGLLVETILPLKPKETTQES